MPRDEHVILQDDSVSYNQLNRTFPWTIALQKIIRDSA